MVTRYLFILRHAKSSWSDLSLDDYDRPLKGRGKRDSENMGQFMVDRGWYPNLVLSSPAKRARQTTIRVCRELGLTTDNIHWRKNLYHAEVPDLMDALRRCPDKLESVMLVGHNPGLEDLTRYLCDPLPPVPEDGKLVPTATLVRIAFKTPWSKLAENEGRILEIIRPRFLPNAFYSP